MINVACCLVHSRHCHACHACSCILLYKYTARTLLVVDLNRYSIHISHIRFLLKKVPNCPQVFPCLYQNQVACRGVLCLKVSYISLYMYSTQKRLINQHFVVLQSTQVCLRAPVSESLSRLHRDQLQKFAQYLISELPQQVNFLSYYILSL